MYELILVPLDGSIQAENAVNEAAKVVQRRGGILTLLQVVPTVEQQYRVAQPNPLDTSEQTQDSVARAAYDEARIKARDYLTGVAKSIKGCGFEVVTRIEEGEPVAEILRMADQTDAQIIVLTPFGVSASSTPPAKGVLGKVADEVLRKAHVPVLVAKHV